jgi:hypothetical protein
MACESFAHVLVTEELLRHVWEGETDKSKGGHRYGLGREGKTEFPSHWSIAMVELAITQVLSMPQSIKYQGIFIYCLRQVGDVLVVVILKMQGTELIIAFAYPSSGSGVYRNDRGLRTPLPLDLSILEN